MPDFAIDIDLTIAEGFLADLRYFNTVMQLNIPVSELLTIPSYEVFNVRPEMRTFARLHRDAYLQALSAVKEDIPTLLAKTPLPCAVEQVTHLAQCGKVRYLTIRKSARPEAQEALEQVTRQWLRLHSFPSPEEVFFPKSFHAKLLYALKGTRQVLLIDDRWQDLLQAFQTLPTKLVDGEAMQERLRKRLTLVAFGMSSPIEHDTGLRLVPLPSWAHAERLSPLIQTAV